jgi:hypothetical protein
MNFLIAQGTVEFMMDENGVAWHSKKLEGAVAEVKRSPRANFD